MARVIHWLIAAMFAGAILMSLELLFALAATLHRVFPSVMLGEGFGGNSMLFAFTRARSAESVRQRLAASNAKLPGMQITEIVPPVGTRQFTDDLAPVEEMTRRMLSGGGQAPPPF